MPSQKPQSFKCSVPTVPEPKQSGRERKGRLPGAADLGLTLTAYRNRLGWSQAELAKYSCVGRATIIDIEAGKVCSRFTYARIVKAFRECTTVSEKFDGEKWWDLASKNTFSVPTFDAAKSPKSQTVAFKVWWELTTRKIALRYDAEHDVLSEVYDSWHAAFGAIRQHAMLLPIAAEPEEGSVARKVLGLCEHLLNSHMRGHLTRWQAIFRTWLANTPPKKGESPQTHQKRFPQYIQLMSDLRITNWEIVKIATDLRAVVFG